MADISKITLDSGTYNIKDTTARNSLTALTTDYNLRTNKKFIFVGDSYLEGWTPDGNMTSFADKICQKLGVTSYVKKYLGGTGFGAAINGKTFSTLLSEITADNNVTDIIVIAGYNDRVALSSVWQGIANFKNVANTNFPNAKIHIGFVGWTTDTDQMFPLGEALDLYIYASKELGIHYMGNMEYTLHQYGVCFSSDGIHPNQTGHNRIADNGAECLINGSCSVYHPYNNIPITNVNSDISNQSFSNSLGETMNNGIVEISSQSYCNVFFGTSQHLTSSGGVTVRLFDIDLTRNTYIIGNKYNFTSCYVPVIIHDDNSKYYNGTGQIIFNSGKIYLKLPGMINLQNNGYLDINVTQVQIMSGIHATFDSLTC